MLVQENRLPLLISSPELGAFTSEKYEKVVTAKVYKKTESD